MKKRVVVTGASGFIGRAVVGALRMRGVEVLPVARRRVPGATVVGDYADTPAGDVLVHLAEDNDRGRVSDAGAAYEARARETLTRLLVKRYSTIVYASSALLYGDAAATPRKTTHTIHAVDAYTRVKKDSEEAVLATGTGIGARLSNVYGAGMSQATVLNTILGQIPGSGPLCVMDDRPVRDFVHSSDVADALATMALGAGEPGIYNVGSGMGTSVRELARVALEIAGESRREIVATRPGMRHSCIVLDVSDTTQTWAWSPRTSLAAGLAELLNAPEEMRRRD